MLLMKEPKKDGPRGRKKKTIGVTKLREERVSKRQQAAV